MTLDADLVGDLRAVARTRGTTLYTVCLAAFQVLLHRYTGETDIVVGSPMAGRTSAGAEDVIGYFANTIACAPAATATRASPTSSRTCRRRVLDALEGQDFPFPLLVERLKVDARSGRAPLCDVLFSWDKPHYREMDRPVGEHRRDLPSSRARSRQLGSTHDLAMVGVRATADGSDAFSTARSLRPKPLRG